jgi:hypothetical protein
MAVERGDQFAIPGSANPAAPRRRRARCLQYRRLIAKPAKKSRHSSPNWQGSF